MKHPVVTQPILNPPVTGRPIRVASLGECMIELGDLESTDGRVAMGVAGDSLNLAIYLARVGGPGISVDYLSALGTDQMSARMLAFMASEGVGTGHIARFADLLPGIYAIELDRAGERAFRYWRSQSAARSMMRPGGLSAETLMQFDVLCLSGISLAILPDEARERLIAIAAAMKAAGRLVVFDSNYRPALWRGEDQARHWMGAMWKATRLGLPSRDDEARLWPGQSVADVFARLDVPEVALKDGAAGPWLFAGQPLPKADYPAAAQIVDTTSAGDAFNAGYLAARLNGHDIYKAAEAGHRLSCAVIGQKGAIITRSAMPQ